ncbi:MAG: hypothetical protein K2G96_03300, partial [Clostridia bacterium]|nr:hypothetical protein [Clostridia bacterium]
QSRWEPQTVKSDPPVALNAPTTYPPHAVKTTTTTRDTTSRTSDAVAGVEADRSRHIDDMPFDIDGFYDAIDEKNK